MTKDKQLKNEIYKERLEMRKKIFILFLILIPFNVFALTRAPIDITNETVTTLSKALNEEIITSEPWIFRLNSVFWKNNWNIRLISEKHIKNGNKSIILWKEN